MTKKLTRREFLKLSGQAIAVTGAACAVSGLGSPRRAAAATTVELDGRELVARVGDTFATIHLVPRYTRSSSPEVYQAKVQYSTDPTLSIYAESYIIASKGLHRPEKGRHVGIDGSSYLQPKARAKLFPHWGIQPGDLIRNKTDNSVMTVTQVTADRTIYGTLVGGMRNVWNKGDKWEFDRFYYSISVPVNGLSPSTRYYYRVLLRRLGDSVWQSGEVHSFVTRRIPNETFSFALIADPHRRESNPPERHNWDEFQVLLHSLKNENVDFLMDLGDTYLIGDGKSNPLTKRFIELYSIGMKAARTGFGPYESLDFLCGDMGYFFCRGNHEGISDYCSDKIKRLYIDLLELWVPNPNGNTYPQGGSHDNDYSQGYYAFEWGNALFVVLDVVKYKETEKNNPTPARFHIGEAQRTWLEEVLRSSSHRWKLIFVHHLFAGCQEYGRGGAAFAYDYEQAIVHDLARQYNAHIFHGHDHLLAAEFADGVLYYCAGCAWGGQFNYGQTPVCYPDGIIPTSCNARPPACDNNGYAVVTVTSDKLVVTYRGYHGNTVHEIELT
jgi:hypothetical protein